MHELRRKGRSDLGRLGEEHAPRDNVVPDKDKNQPHDGAQRDGRPDILVALLAPALRFAV